MVKPLLQEEIQGRIVLVVGLARSGVAAAKLAAQMGAGQVVVADIRPAEKLQREIGELAKLPGVTVAAGSNDPGLVTADTAMVVKSPGVPPTLELLTRATQMGIPVLSEVELAYAFIKAPLIGITGTNGKTTTTVLVAEMLKEARFSQVLAAGNIGLPLSEAARTVGPSGIIVAELSSFQLEDIRSFRPSVAVFLNFEEDHLDYHGTIERYFKAKARIIENQTAADYAVLNAGDPAVASLATEIKGELLWFKRGELSAGFGVINGQAALFHPGGRQYICPLEEIALPGEHNLENALAAAAAAWAAGAELPAIAVVLRRFRGVEHRLEQVAVKGGVEYINDSKGTNPGAAIKALRSFPGRKKILIAGGKDKGSDFSTLAEAIKAEEVKLLILLGETADQLAQAVEKAGFHSYLKVSSFEEAVVTASARAESGELVLLSPACASWDMFANFEERGRLFKELVASL